MNELLSTAECPSHLLSQDEINRLATAANESSKDLESITHKLIES